jgi:ureidoglycolate lyase
MPPKLLPARSITPENFAPYGDVLNAQGHVSRDINAGTSARAEMPDPELLEQGGRPSLSIFRARAATLPFTATLLERHRLGSQSFIPLGGTAFAVLVALGEDKPDPASLAAFLVDGRSGITLRRDTWHHPLIALADGDFVVLERAAEQVDCEIMTLAQAVELYVARAGAEG